MAGLGMLSEAAAGRNWPATTTERSPMTWWDPGITLVWHVLQRVQALASRDREGGSSRDGSESKQIGRSGRDGGNPRQSSQGD